MEVTLHGTSIADDRLAGDDVTPGRSSQHAVAEKQQSHDEPTLSEDTQFNGEEYAYASSASSTQESSNDILLEYMDDEEDPARLNSRASSRSSISSVPASSVLIHPPPENDIKPSIPEDDAQNYTPTHPWADTYGTGKSPTFAKPLHVIRQRDATGGGFRNPSSVRAMQMHTEDEDDDEYLTPPRRRGGQRGPSPGSSPLKRSPQYYSPNSKPKVKKEYPLVLLHCNLLAPSLALPGSVGAPSQKILKEVFPSRYWRRWRLLQEKVGSGVLRDRGVLISHPQDGYDLLEERLLESLELQRPRLDGGHFLGQESDSDEREGYSDRDRIGSAEDEQDDECPDCGGRVNKGSHSRKKWEVKVYAANGLMKAGAWAAAWKEMEKVDVEVGLWLPREVRKTLEARLLQEEKSNDQDDLQVPKTETDQDSRSSHYRSPSLDQPPPSLHHKHQVDQESAPQKRPEHPSTADFSQPRQEVDLRTLLVNYLRVLASDRRNIAMFVLSVVVVLLAIGGKSQSPTSDLRPFPEIFDSIPTASGVEHTMTDSKNFPRSAVHNSDDLLTSAAAPADNPESTSSATGTNPEDCPTSSPMPDKLETSTEHAEEPVSPYSIPEERTAPTHEDGEDDDPAILHQGF